MEKTYKHIDLGYEFWKKGYMFRNSIAGEAEAYKLYVGMCDEGLISNVDDFFAWILDVKPEMIFDYVEEERKYQIENEPKIREFFAEHIEGKTWKEIDPEIFQFYSDWHKDVFGYRPHGIVCGEYINPHR